MAIAIGDIWRGIGGDILNVRGAGVARGGDGGDILTGSGSLYTLHGDSGADKFNLNGTGDGDAFGGEDGDIYNVNTTGIIAIRYTGTVGVDYVYLNNIGRGIDLFQQRVGDDL